MQKRLIAFTAMAALTAFGVLAQDAEDLAVISAALQDAVGKIGDGASQVGNGRKCRELGRRQ